MHFKPLFGAAAVVITLLTSTVTSSSLSKDSFSANAANLPFELQYLFTAQLNLGQPSKPINVTDGVLIIEPILNGTVTGPALNATLTYSLATPTASDNDTVQVPVINAVGATEDGFPVYIYETGIGTPKGQITRLVSSGNLSSKQQHVWYLRVLK